MTSNTNSPATDVGKSADLNAKLGSKVANLFLAGALRQAPFSHSFFSSLGLSFKGFVVLNRSDGLTILAKFREVHDFGHDVIVALVSKDCLCEHESWDELTRLSFSPVQDFWKDQKNFRDLLRTGLLVVLWEDLKAHPLLQGLIA